MTEKEQFEHIIRRFYGADDNAYEAASDLTELLWPAIEHLAKNRFVGLSSAALDERDSIMANEAAEQTLVRAENVVRKMCGLQSREGDTISRSDVLALLGALRKTT